MSRWSLLAQDQTAASGTCPGSDPGPSSHWPRCLYNQQRAQRNPPTHPIQGV